jgi:hypothetical protein
MLTRKTSSTKINHRVSILLFVCLLSLSLENLLTAQDSQDQITIGDDGVMRWTKDQKEVTGFGTNYTVPFAYAYRNGKKMGVNLKAAIDQDVYQFARLGFDLYRVHVWDTEISDTLGNLLQNEHLDLFDYLLAQLKKHHINAIITPIAYWGNGWPEKDEDTPGFSHKYGKANCLVNPDAIKAQVNYLHQFVNHVNPYLGKAYKDEPMILAFEVCNEPHHEGTPAEVTTFVKRMKDAIRQTGCTKPVFYNVSHKIQLADAYFAAGIDGGTFQWYPTGLGFQKELGGNMLPNVDRYPIPFDDVLKKNHAARFVYEFDAADLAKNYLYPAMARSFRTAGIQLATQFAWDPTFTAPYNTEYNTHFMNLLYAPQKALSLMICGEIFRNIPLYSDYGIYPDNTHFGPFHVSYEDNLAEMVSDEKFIYTNNTTSQPPAPDKLKLIAGWGNSPLVEYEGTGAYFLDKVGDEMWRLEIMPDAVQVNNLFGRNSLDKVVAVVKQESRKMKFHLPGFEEGFAIENKDGHDSIINSSTKDKTISLNPGIYLIMGRKYLDDRSQMAEAKKSASLGNDLVYPSSPDSIYFYHQDDERWFEGKDHKLTAIIIGPEKPKKVIVDYYTLQDGLVSNFEMKEVKPFTYEAIIPGKNILTDTFYYVYNFELESESGDKTLLNHFEYPHSHDIPNPHEVTGYAVNVAKPSDQIYLFLAQDLDRSNKGWLPSFQNKSKFFQFEPDLVRLNVDISIDSLIKRDSENQLATPIPDYTIRHFFADRLKEREKEFFNKKTLYLEAHTVDGHSYPVQLALVQKDGTAYGGIVQVNDHDKTYSISLDQLKAVPVVLMPRPYPTFLPYFSDVKPGIHLDLSQIESLQISIGPGIPKEDLDKPVEVILESVWLE